MLDHTKVGQGALYRLGDVDEFTHVVLDASVPREEVERIEERGVQVIVV